MLPFCGYNMGDYFRHWISMQKKISETPRIFHVNWFRKNAAGKFLWPGFGDNMRVLEWMLKRVEGKVPGRVTAIGTLPEAGELSRNGLAVSDADLETLLAVDTPAWRTEVGAIAEGGHAAVLAQHAGASVPASTPMLFAETDVDHAFVMEEQMMPMLPVVRVKSIEQGIELARTTIARAFQRTMADTRCSSSRLPGKAA